jgi:hypothetical protein
MSCRHKKETDFKYQIPPCSYISFFVKVASLQVVHPLKIYEYKISWFCISLRSLNVHHFGIVAATVLKIIASRHLQRHDLRTEFHESLPNSSEVDGGGGNRHTDRMVISLAVFFL